jgi:hypothetical protein
MPEAIPTTPGAEKDVGISHKTVGIWRLPTLPCRLPARHSESAATDSTECNLLTPPGGFYRCVRESGHSGSRVKADSAQEARWRGVAMVIRFEVVLSALVT